MKDIIDKIQVQGFVKLELYDKDGNIKQNVEKGNFIAKPLKHYILKNGIANILEMNAHIQGQMATSGASFWNNFNGTELGRKYKIDNAMTNFILQLDNTQHSGLSANSNFIDIWNSDMTDASKVLGYCNMNPNPLNDGKEGEMQDPRPIDNITPNVITKTFKYGDGVGTGTVNCVMMASKNILASPSGYNDSADENNCPGIINSKLIDQVNVSSSNFSSLSNKIIPPGITNGTDTVTAEDEIIINYNQDGVSRHKVNLTTGETTEDTGTFPFPDVFIDYKVIGDYVYYLRQSGYTFRLDCYQISTGTAIYTNRILGDSYKRTAALLYDSANDKLYLTAARYNDSYPNQLLEITKSGGYFYNAGTAQTDYSAIATFPAGFNQKMCCIGNYGSDYILYIAQYTANGNSSDCRVGYLFSDLSDVRGSIYGCIPTVNKFVFKNATLGGMLSIGKYATSVDTPNAADTLSRYYVSSLLYNDANLRNAGVFYTKENDWCNFVSAVILTGQDIINKGASDVLKITYGYRIIT